MRSFCSAKASLIFSTKNISVFGYKAVKHLTSWPLNELIKLTMLWTTGPCTISHILMVTGSESEDNCLFSQLPQCYIMPMTNCHVCGYSEGTQMSCQWVMCLILQWGSSHLFSTAYTQGINMSANLCFLRELSAIFGFRWGRPWSPASCRDCCTW